MTDLCVHPLPPNDTAFAAALARPLFPAVVTLTVASSPGQWPTCSTSELPCLPSVFASALPLCGGFFDPSCMLLTPGRVEGCSIRDGCSYRLRASFCEIYNEQIYDLLVGDRRQLQVGAAYAQPGHLPVWGMPGGSAELES